MAKKKGGDKKKDKKKKNDGGSDESKKGEGKVDVPAPTDDKRDLIREAVRIKNELLSEEREFNDFQQQREKLNYFWIVEKKNLEDQKAEFRNKERELQDLEEKHQIEIKVYKQRVKHLLFEHQNEVAAHKIENESTLSLSQSEHLTSEAELKGDRRGLHFQTKEAELSNQDYLRSLKQEQDRAITSLRQTFERRAKELLMRFDKKSKTVRDSLELRRKTEISRMEQRKDWHIEELMKTHEKAFGEIKNYYNDITHNNLDLIKSLKEEVAEMKKKESADEKLMFEIAQENKRMSEPLKQALQDVERLRGELEDYKVVKARLRNTKAELVVLEDKLKALKWEEEVLQQRFEIVEMERDELYRRFHSTVFDVQQKAGFRKLLLENRLAAISHELERTEGHLGHALQQFNLDPKLRGRVQSKLDDIIESKNRVVRSLQQSLLQAASRHNETVEGFRAKLIEYGIPAEELGFEPELSHPPTHLK